MAGVDVGHAPLPEPWPEEGLRQDLRRLGYRTVDESLGWVPEVGWREIETQIDRIDGMVRITIYEKETAQTIYSVRYSPDTARLLAQTLTMNSIQIEDENA
jgi:hypothetical protein